MKVMAKAHGGQTNRGLPVGQLFHRLIHAGDIFDIPDDPVPHMEDDPLGEKDPKTGKVLQVKAIAFRPSTRRGTEAPVELTELESRREILRRNPDARRWSKEDRDLYLKFRYYSPVWMKPAQRGAHNTIDPSKTTSEIGNAIPDGQPGTKTSVGDGDTGATIVDMNKMSVKEAVNLVNATNDPAALQSMLAQEKAGQKRPNVLNALNAQMQLAASGQQQ